MAGLYTDGLPNLDTLFGLEQAPFDTQLASGANPQSGSINVQELALWMSLYTDSVSGTTVAGSRYFRSIQLGYPYVANGCNIKVGGTGGTDLWSVQLWSPTGALLARSSISSATTAGTANTWQQIAFTSTYALTQPGTYFIGFQSNGSTASYAAINAPSSSAILSGSATGTYASPGSITPPTAYTIAQAPKIVLY